MHTRRPTDRHSDLGPSSKDWQPGSVGRDEDYSPESDRWAQTHPQSEGASGSTDGEERHSERPAPDDEEALLDTALEDSFPASDPPAPAHPDVTGWDLDEGAEGKAGGKR